MQLIFAIKQSHFSVSMGFRRIRHSLPSFYGPNDESIGKLVFRLFDNSNKWLITAAVTSFTNIWILEVFDVSPDC